MCAFGEDVEKTDSNNVRFFNQLNSSKHEISSDNLLESLRSSFISRSLPAEDQLLPSLLTNNYQQNKKILSSIEYELESCEAFDFSVAFINDSGLASLLQKLEELREFNVPGRILTTNYLNFTTPGSLSKLLEFPNIEVRVYTHGGFHPKGYIFKQSNYYSIIIGSANLTAAALSQNQEWSIKFLSCTDGQIVFSVREEFERIWKNSEPVTSEWIEKYSVEWKQNRVRLPSPEILSEIQAEHSVENGNLESAKNTEELEIVPNAMQKEAMTSIAALRAKGENRALLIAATGTGKTYLSIFDVKQFSPKKVLYVAHRDMILSKSEESFRTLLPGIKTGFLSGTKKELNADYLFASVFTLSKDNVLSLFKKNEFDYIIIDEVHHAGAESYRKIIDYFTPGFLLGLTATPERTDGFNIFELFHYNIPYEIRLQKALEENLLCPFHYYGLSDLTVNGETIDDKSDFKKLTSDERLRHIEKALKLYKSNDIPVKGLIFCSNIDEAKALSEKLNHDGFFTTFLIGETSDYKREKAIERLESDSDPLQYIISVDIFNEGVDIPCVNQVVMLRPTQSAIIFVQQLGRGLRKDRSKNFVSVIDFIGNYENNFFIPVALYGDNSFNKDNLRRELFGGSSALPGSSTIQINEIARQKIFNSINQTSFCQFRKQEYTKVKQRLGRIPCMMDFIKNDAMDPVNIMFKVYKTKDKTSFSYEQTYYEFVCKIEKIEMTLSQEELKCLTFVSKELSNGIRLHEILLLKYLINDGRISKTEFKNKLESNSVSVYEADIDSCINIINGYFFMKINSKTNKKERIYNNFDYLITTKDEYIVSKEFKELLSNETLKMNLLDVIEYALNNWKTKYSKNIQKNNFVLYKKYTRKDVCRLLNWRSDCSSTIYGYKTETSYPEYSCPIFVTYEKSDDISATTKYDDVFVDNSRFSWMSRSRRTSASDEVAKIIEQPQNNIKVMLFLKKNNDEGNDFYYLGDMRYDSFEDTKMNSADGKVDVVNILFNMETPVPQNLYSYLTA